MLCEIGSVCKDELMYVTVQGKLQQAGSKHISAIQQEQRISQQNVKVQVDNDHKEKDPVENSQKELLPVFCNLKTTFIPENKRQTNNFAVTPQFEYKTF